MSPGSNDRIFGGLSQLHGRIDARHIRILLFVLLAALTVVGCDSDNGGGY